MSEKKLREEQAEHGNKKKVNVRRKVTLKGDAVCVVSSYQMPYIRRHACAMLIFKSLGCLF